MAKHEVSSRRLTRARRLAGGVIVGSALAIAAPAGLAMADAGDVDNPVDTRDANPVANVVDRPNFNGAPGDTSAQAGNNPAPLVRATQLVGDRVFNQNNPVNSFIDNTFGDPYHRDYGYPGGATIENPDFDENEPPGADNPQYIIDPGRNGRWQGVLNNGAFYNFTGGPYDLAQEVGVPLPSEGGFASVTPVSARSGSGSAGVCTLTNKTAMKISC
jgi:hypothetical protein